MGLIKKLTSFVVTSSLVLGLVGTAFAAPTAAQTNFAYDRLSTYGIVQGKVQANGTTSPALGDSITRAELVTVIVRAFGKEETAKLLKGASSFSDVGAAEWHSGYIALAKNMAESKGISLGYPDGTFKPAQVVTQIEALALIMKFLGVAPGTGANWVADTVAAAKSAGVLTDADATALIDNPNSAANRGLAFTLADAIFSTYKVAGNNTVYTTYIDTTKPELTVAKVETTDKAKLNVTGTVKGATALYAGADKLTFGADGSFSYEMALKIGANEVVFSAVDLAGNVTSNTFKVTRVAGAAAKIEASAAALEVVAGGTADLTAKVVDANGVELKDLVATVAIGGNVGTLEAGKFTAAKAAGTGTVTFTYGELAAVTVNVTVKAGPLAKIAVDKASIGVGEKATLTAQDEHGNAVAGATFSVDKADAFLNGSVFTATAAGTYKVTATANGASATTNVGVFSTTLAKYSVTASAANVIANQASEFTVTVKGLDSNNNTIASSTQAFTWGAAAVALFQIKTTAGTWVALNDPAAPAALDKGVLTATLRTASGVLGGQIAEIAVSDAATKTGKTSIDLVDQIASGVKVSTTDVYLPNNAGTENAAFSIQVTDQAGKAMKIGAYAVKVTIAGPGLLVDDTNETNPATSKDRVYSGTTLTQHVVSKLGESGTVSVTAAVEGLGNHSASVTALAAQAASKLVITQDKTTGTAADQTEVTFTIKVTDAQGVPVAATPTLVVAKFSGVADADVAQISTKVNAGAYTALDSTKKVALTFTAGEATLKVTAYKFVGTLGVSFEDEATSNKLAGGSFSIAFSAHTATKVKLTRSNNINVPATNPETTLTAQLYDVAGNVAKVAGKSLTFSSASTDVIINGGSNTATVQTDAEGKASVTVRVLGYVGASYVYTVVVDGAANSSITNYADGTQDVTVTPSNAVATSVSLNITNSLGNVTSVATAGDTMTLSATPKDAAGKVLLGETLTVTVTEGKTAATVTLADGDNDGVYTGTFVPTKAGRLTLTVKDTTAATTVESAISMSVRAGTVAKVLVERADYTEPGISTTSGTATAFRLIPTDTYGNLSAKTDGSITVTLTVDAADIAAGKYFEIRSSAGGANLLVANVATFTLSAGSTGVTFFVLTNDIDGVDVTVAANASLTGEIVTFTGK